MVNKESILSWLDGLSTPRTSRKRTALENDTIRNNKRVRRSCERFRADKPCAAGPTSPVLSEVEDDLPSGFDPCSADAEEEEMAAFERSKSYRIDHLCYNELNFIHHPKRLPAQIAVLNEAILRRPRPGSTGLTDDEAAPECDELSELTASSNSRCMKGGVLDRLLPQMNAPSISVHDQIMYATYAPRGKDTGVSIPPISTPQPWITYGYSAEPERKLQRRQTTVVSGTDLRKLLRTSPGISRPFLVAEVNDEYNTVYDVRSECASAGATCANVGAQLYRLAKECSGGAEPQVDSSINISVPSISYTAFICGLQAEIWVNWADDDCTTFHSGLASYRYAFLHPESYSLFRNHILNILDWGSKDRYHYQNRLLEIIDQYRSNKPLLESDLFPKASSSVINLRRGWALS